MARLKPRHRRYSFPAEGMMRGYFEVSRGGNSIEGRLTAGLIHFPLVQGKQPPRIRFGFEKQRQSIQYVMFSIEAPQQKVQVHILLKLFKNLDAAGPKRPRCCE
jgi:hypothetical protein